jgi:Fe-Mn family superoxide dismutase
MFSLPPLPYAYDALAPTLSEVTMRTHHDKHHKTYVETLNRLLAEAGDTPDSLEAVIERTAGDKGKLFNNAGQAWNHGFFWESMTPERSEPGREFAALRQMFVTEGAEHFGSGWLWITARDGSPTILTTHDADTLACRPELTPVLVCDLWEHAYYLDYKNDRKGFLGKWFDEVANWRFAETQLRAAQGQGERYRYPKPVGERASIGETAQTQIQAASPKTA